MKAFRIIQADPFNTGSDYIPTISGDFQSRNSQILGEEVIVSFTAGN